MNDETLDGAASREDRGLDAALRPQVFDEFVGQPAICKNLQIYIKAARMRGDPLDHLLLSGLPGLGKTTLAEIVARRMETALHTTSGPVLEKPGDLAGILTNLAHGDVLFVDEIHRMPAIVEEYLYSAMEDFTIDILLDQGPRARSVRIDLQPFTLIGATTREGLLTPPFRARFGVLERLEPYPVEELASIGTRSSGLLGMALTEDGATTLAMHARGTPRVVNRFVRRIRDLAQVEGRTEIDSEIAKRGLAMLGVDDDGLLPVDRAILQVLLSAEGRPVGLRTIAASVGEDDRTLEDVYEPHLMRTGLVLKTPRGRILTAAAYDLLQVEAPTPQEEPEEQPGLFDG